MQITVNANGGKLLKPRLRSREHEPLYKRGLVLPTKHFNVSYSFALFFTEWH